MEANKIILKTHSLADCLILHCNYSRAKGPTVPTANHVITYTNSNNNQGMMSSNQQFS